jgi:hypothetical protein
MSVLSSARRRLRSITLVGASVFLTSQFFSVHAAALPEDAPMLISDAYSTRAIMTLSRFAEDPSGSHRSGRA